MERTTHNCIFAQGIPADAIGRTNNSTYQLKETYFPDDVDATNPLLKTLSG